MYFYLGSPNGPYFDFIEFTVGASSINVDTTRVDRFGLKLALLLHGHDGSSQEVGDSYATFTESRAATFSRFENFVPAEFKELATDQAPYGIPSPGNDPAFQPGGAYASYLTGYAAANGDGSDTTAQIFGCGGTLAANATALQVTFSEAVLGAGTAANYELRRAGTDGLLGTADDPILTVAPNYSGTTATLTFAPLLFATATS